MKKPRPKADATKNAPHSSTFQNVINIELASKKKSQSGSSVPPVPLNCSSTALLDSTLSETLSLDEFTEKSYHHPCLKLFQPIFPLSFLVY
jgi:hypothetical protein